MNNPKNPVIYEMLLRDFTSQGTLAGAMQKLDYLKDLGIDAIELMPVEEFTGNDSWGYNTGAYFALDDSYGTVNDYTRPS
jgi:1,4-alpha-glucan branching enzyme